MAGFRNLLMVVVVLCFLSKTYCQYNLSNPDIAIEASVENIDLVHLISNNNSYQEINKDEALGQVAPLPDLLTANFQNQIIKSKILYQKKQYYEASEILKEAARTESKNPFILNEYARALYRVEDKADICYKTYKKLIRILDSTYNNSDSIMVIDVWFREAYWKLGTLHMDNGNWSDAFYEINRFLCSIQDEKGEIVYEQALSYLTECAYEMKNFDLCLHFANRTLFYNSENEYAKYYLDRLK